MPLLNRNPYRKRPLLNLLERFDFFIESHADYVVAVMLILMIVFICLCGGADAFKDDIDIKPNIERYKDAQKSLDNQNIYQWKMKKRHNALIVAKK